MRSSKLFFPKPKFLRVVRANLLCSFHNWPLDMIKPGKRKPTLCKKANKTREVSEGRKRALKCLKLFREIISKHLI